MHGANKTPLYVTPLNLAMRGSRPRRHARTVRLMLESIKALFHFFPLALTNCEFEIREMSWVRVNIRGPVVVTMEVSEHDSDLIFTPIYPVTN